MTTSNRGRIRDEKRRNKISSFGGMSSRHTTTALLATKDVARTEAKRGPPSLLSSSFKSSKRSPGLQQQRRPAMMKRSSDDQQKRDAASNMILHEKIAYCNHGTSNNAEVQQQSPQNPQPIPEPGAFRTAPSSPPLGQGIITQQLEEDAGGCLWSQHDSATATSNTFSSSMMNLAEAVTVPSDEVQAVAREVDLKDLERDTKTKVQKQKKETECRRIGHVLVTISLIVLAITLGVVLTRRKNKNLQDTTANITPSSSTLVPSMAPSSYANQLLDVLPEYTLTSLMDPQSPQSLAYDWLSMHRDISTMQEWRMKQLFALACFYYAFDGPNWPFQLDGDWLDDSRSECEWFSWLFGKFDGQYYHEVEPDQLVTCNPQGEFTVLIICGPKTPEPPMTIYNAMMPPELGLLTSLEVLRLNNHDLRNASTETMLPSQLTQLTNLSLLDLRGCQLTGTIPSSLGQMTNLTDLNLSRNPIGGTVPTEVGLLQNLEHLSIFKSEVMGILPTELGMLTDLTDLNLEANQLTGTLPTELALCNSMQYFNLKNNNISGKIPTQFGELTSLIELDLGETLLSGTIPEGLVDDMKNLSYFNLHNCSQLNGNIPEQLCLLNDKNCSYSKEKDGEEDFHCMVSFDCSDALCGCHCPCLD